MSAIADRRVEVLVEWAQRGAEPLSGRAGTALEEMTASPPDASAAAALALAAAAAYARVPMRGPRDLQAGHVLVDVLGALGEAGAAELIRLRERVRYHYARRRIERVLADLQRRLGIPLGELEDAFAGPELDRDLSLALEVGPFEARLSVREDLRRVRTVWRDGSGRPRASRPALVRNHPEELALVALERRRLRAHLRDLRLRLEDAMVSGRSWSAEEWAARMFNAPLRAALTRRMIWQVQDKATTLALPEKGGLRDADGEAVQLSTTSALTLWHPAEDPALQRDWQQRLALLNVDQPVEQAWREVTAADPSSPRVGLGAGRPVRQTAFRGFLLGRGWEVPYLGPYFEVPEATREMTPHGPVAVLFLEHDTSDEDAVVVRELAFRSVHDVDLDARTLPPAIVSEAARDALGALAAAQ